MDVPWADAVTDNVHKKRSIMAAIIYDIARMHGVPKLTLAELGIRNGNYLTVPKTVLQKEKIARTRCGFAIQGLAP